MLRVLASVLSLWLFVAFALPTDIRAAVNRSYNCPFQDNLGFKSKELQRLAALKSSDELICAFQPNGMSTPDRMDGDTESLSFHCVYSLTSGGLKSDWNMGGCPMQAPRAPLTLNRRNTLPRSPVVRGLRMVDVRRGVMRIRTQLGAKRAKRNTV
ncbi:hypothetical protein BKA70DRAFT_1471244 [Coprinopsis sp. MPI-PUGE-AT-0042]|nr:hypothetical protein BKA70DRAFT_1471244 [Coprinopsis sp. MPI-PUGE-AT-0042]